MFKPSIFIIIVLNSYTLYSQISDLPTGPNNRFYIGIGLPFYKIRDRAQSPMIYRGVGLQIKIGVEDVNRSTSQRAELIYNFGAISPNGAPKPKHILSMAALQNLQFSYARYYRTGEYVAGASHLFIGGAFIASVDIRDYNLPSNNTTGFNINLSIAGGSLLRKMVGDKTALQGEALMPLIGYDARPNYIGLPIQKENFRLSTLRTTATLAPFYKAFRLITRIEGEYRNSDYRYTKLAYDWDFRNDAASVNLKSITADLSLLSFFKT